MGYIRFFHDIVVGPSNGAWDEEDVIKAIDSFVAEHEGVKYSVIGTSMNRYGEKCISVKYESYDDIDIPEFIKSVIDKFPNERVRFRTQREIERQEHRQKKIEARAAERAVKEKEIELRKIQRIHKEAVHGYYFHIPTSIYSDIVKVAVDEGKTIRTVLIDLIKAGLEKRKEAEW